MDEYPDYRFSCSQAVQYDWIRQDYPRLFERIKEKVRAGQWEPVGSMWVEADCNIASGEALVRQVVHGKRFFLEHFGVETEDMWLPDVFGYAASMPQIMTAGGIRYFLTQKLSWNQFNPMPHHTFLWEGIDGSRVFTHFPPADTYNGQLDSAEVLYQVRNFKDHAHSNRSLALFGFGDGGGGPTRQMLESAQRLRDLEGVPRVQLEPALSFFKAASDEIIEPAVWVGELYFELHRGTYTSQAAAKAGNRRGELLLRDAETWATFAGVHGGGYPRTELDAAWKTLLLNQFHDILPGSSIHWVYQDTRNDHAEVARVARGIASGAREAIAAGVSTEGTLHPVVAFNPNSHPRRALVVLDQAPAGDLLAVDAEGRQSAVQRSGELVMFQADIPSCGYATLDLRPGSHPVAAPVRVHGRSFDNGVLRLSWDEGGLLTSVFDLRCGREVLAPGSRGNLLQLHPDYPVNWDAWDLDAHYSATSEDLVEATRVEIVEAGPLRATLRVERHFSKSWCVQEMRLEAGSALLRFDTEVEWREDHRILKAAFPVDIHSPKATYEIQFGHVERPTHANTSWDEARFEVCAQRWVDLGENGYGVALLNDSKYGHDIHGNVIRLSLLRAPTAPDPTADRGRHHFTYALLPHPGDFRDAGVIEAAYDLNVPVVSVAVAPGQGGRNAAASFLSVSRPGVVVEAIKLADEEDAVVVRLYEAHGGRGPVQLDFATDVTGAYRTDLLERRQGQLELKGRSLELELKPFEIVTILLETRVPLRDGERLAFLGDSLTQGGWEKPDGWVRLLLRTLAAEGINLTPIPAGVGGHTSVDMLARLKADVLDQRPDWVLLSCGVNDVWQGEGGVPLAEYQRAVRGMAEQIQASGARLLLITATMIGEDLDSQVNLDLAPYNEFLADLARELGVRLVDAAGHFRERIQAGPGSGSHLTIDGVHFNDDGERVMAAGVLRGLGFTGSLEKPRRRDS
ncbi:MAG: glycoside hydrolase family 38 N-terminal domain-containing protein [Candidatus Dormibacteria bacterium]